MSKRKKEPEGEMNFERWLLPYADMITLLLAFFIIMYALTLIEKDKAAKIMEEMAKAFGGGAADTQGTPGLVAGGKKFPQPMIEYTGVYKKGTNKKVSSVENTGKIPTIGNIVNITAVGGTGETVFLGTDPELIEKLKTIDPRLLGRRLGAGDKGADGDISKDILIRTGKSKKLPSTGEVNLVMPGAGGKKEGDKGGQTAGERSGDMGGKTAGESGGDIGEDDGGTIGEEEDANFPYKVNDPYLESIAGKLKTMFSEELKTASLEIKVTQRGIEMIISGDIMFELGSIEILPQSIKVVEKLCAVMKYLGTQGFNFRVEGHTDNINVHSFLYPSNWELSCARAVAVVRYMTESLSLEPETVSASGFGRFRPIADNSTPEGRRKNRRIEILIYDPLNPPNVSGELNKKSDSYYKNLLEQEKRLKNKNAKPGVPVLATGEVRLTPPSVSAAATAETISQQPPAKVIFGSATSEIRIKNK